ncbi:copper chaperone PCu(A)C [Leucobacter sp. NPDC015123]|uniref:copper chaperone PCu(A)C n=1 Tax=Leucobacter sp. NPDC015123 TaxID=3364129 RepID=UPI0036F4970A
MFNTHIRATRFTVACGIALLALSGCSAGEAATGSGAYSGEHPGAAAAHPAADSVTIEEAWVKSAEKGEMTAAFGLLKNSSDTDANIVSVTSTASPMMELHETVANESGQMVMREVEGGFVIPAAGQFSLEPAGNHIMIMGLPSAVTAGEDITFTLEFADGSKLDFTAIVKDYAGANENYEGDHDDHAADGAAAGHDAHSGH